MQTIGILYTAFGNKTPLPIMKTYTRLAEASLSPKHFLTWPRPSPPRQPPLSLPPITSNHTSSDLSSVTCVGIRCHACLSITQILIDKIPRPYTACPLKGYHQRMLRINTDLICHCLRWGSANKAHGNAAHRNPSWLSGLMQLVATQPVVPQICFFSFHVSNQIKSHKRT